MSVLVEMTEEECARRWLEKNGLVAVAWPGMNKLVEVQLDNPFVCLDTSGPTYILLADRH